MPQYPIHGSVHFDVREFVHPRTWKELRESPTLCEWQIDPKIVRICDLLRELSGLPVIVNNWHYWKSGKKYVSSGHRAKYDTTGASYSQHRLGRAADVKITGWTPKQIFDLIMDHNGNKAEFLNAGLTTIEDLAMTPTWIHLDCRPRVDGSPDILIVQP